MKSNYGKASIIPTDLGFFGENDPLPEGNHGQDPADAEVTGAEDKNTDGDGVDSARFTQEDMNKVVAERLNRERSKLQKEFDSKLAAGLQEARTEAEKLAKMNSEQKAQYEKEKLEGALKQQEQDLNQRAAEIARKEMDMQVKDILAEKGFPPNLSILIEAGDAEQATEKIGVLEGYLKKAVEDMTKMGVAGAAASYGIAKAVGSGMGAYRETVEVQTKLNHLMQQNLDATGVQIQKVIALTKEYEKVGVISAKAQQAGPKN